MEDGAVGNAFRDKRAGFAGSRGVADGLQVARDLAGEHFDVAGAPHAQRGAGIGGGLLRDWTPISSTLPLVGSLSKGSNVRKSNRCPSTKTLATMSPPPPGMPNGWAWQPAQELASGAESRLKLRGKTSGCARSASGAPVPLVKGRPPLPVPSKRGEQVSAVLDELRQRDLDSSPSCKWRGMATSRPMGVCR